MIFMVFNIFFDKGSPGLQGVIGEQGPEGQIGINFHYDLEK